MDSHSGVTSESDDELEEVIADAKSAEMQLLPEKSKVKYWKEFKPSTLWAYYSMIKSTLKLNENIDIGTYHKLSAFLRTKSKGYKPVKAAIFSKENINNFIVNAPDIDWLDVKVVCIFGICGAMRSDELTRITINDVEQHGDLLLVQILETKTKITRSFTISDPFKDYVKRYAALRSSRTVGHRFFVNYRSGRCTNQVIGKNMFSKMPERIATFLDLKDAKGYAGHSFRRSSASILANFGATMERLQRHGGWRSSTVAEGYVENSVNYKETTGEMITSAVMM